MSEGMEGCSIPSTDNLSLATISYLVFLTFQALVGMSLNAFIVVVNCIDGIRKRHLKSVDKILTAMGISRFCYLCTLQVKYFWMAISLQALELTSLFRAFKAVIWCLTCSNLCFSACLCAFYCAKIANFQHYIFIHLKMRISRMVPWLLLASVFLSLVNTIPFYRGIYTITCKNNNSSSELGNDTLVDITMETDFLNLFLFCGIGFSLAFFVLAMSSFLLLFSVWRHTHQMQKGLASFSNPSMAAHFKAVKTIISFLIIEGVNFIALMLLLANIYGERSPASQVCAIILYVCPAVQSNTLIWGNPKFKRVFIRVMHYIQHMF
ncbi:taste receptor type 2 member 40-like [Hemicordylus capensis]|uniref:taste receptor type 2 member 40-like n=1 Tax=Hemicordylus capensis TaxID=884348 RepID=UPI00230295F5|nr:taste receptor type 2 member 40-like [Hemicordylus capensis]